MYNGGFSFFHFLLHFFVNVSYAGGAHTRARSRYARYARGHPQEDFFHFVLSEEKALEKQQVSKCGEKCSAYKPLFLGVIFLTSGFVSFVRNNPAAFRRLDRRLGAWCNHQANGQTPFIHPHRVARGWAKSRKPLAPIFNTEKTNGD